MHGLPRHGRAHAEQVHPRRQPRLGPPRRPAVVGPLVVDLPLARVPAVGPDQVQRPPGGLQRTRIHRRATGDDLGIIRPARPAVGRAAVVDVAPMPPDDVNVLPVHDERVRPAGRADRPAAPAQGHRVGPGTRSPSRGCGRGGTLMRAALRRQGHSRRQRRHNCQERPTRHGRHSFRVAVPHTSNVLPMCTKCAPWRELSPGCRRQH